MPQPSSSFKRWGSWALHRDAPSLLPPNSTLLMRNFSPAAGSCWKPWSAWSLSLRRHRPFWTYSSPLFSSRLTSDNPRSARIPHTHHWITSGDLSWESRWMEGSTPFSLLSYYRAHRSASKGREKLRVKPVEVLEKLHHWFYCWLLTAPETPAMLSACTTFWMLHFKLLFAWSCCP